MNQNFIFLLFKVLPWQFAFLIGLDSKILLLDCIQNVLTAWNYPLSSNFSNHLKYLKNPSSYKMMQKKYKFMKQSAENNVIDGDEEQLDDVADASHDGESQCTWLSDLFEFYIIRLKYLRHLAFHKLPKICKSQLRTFWLRRHRFRFLCSCVIVLN